MRKHVLIWVLVAVVHLPRTVWAADMGTAFTYQGRLEKPAGVPLPVGTCDFHFRLWDAETNGTQINNITLERLGVSVLTGGYVFVGDLDFGSDAINGTARWLEIELKCSGDNGFALLQP